MINKKKYDFAVVTATYNRKKSLKRLYDSICNQTYKDFFWLIVDDGSDDNTVELIELFQRESKINIRYIYKPTNEGKYMALIESFKYTMDSLYYCTIDSDDELHPSALEIFKRTWDNIEKEGLASQIGLIKAQTKRYNEALIPNPFFLKDNCIDMSYQDATFKFNNWAELSTCLRCDELSKFLIIPKKFIYSNKVKCFPECILWARAGRKTLTRYISDVTIIVHIDSEDSLIRPKDKVNRNYMYLSIVSTVYNLFENFDYLWKYQKIRTLKIIIFHTAKCRLVGIRFKEIFHNLKLRRVKSLAIIFLPISLIVELAYKILEFVKNIARERQP